MIAYYRLREAILRVERKPDDLAGAAVTPEKLEELRNSERFADLLGEIRAEAELAAKEPVPALDFADLKAFRERGTRLETERPYFRRRARLLALTLALLIDEDEAHLEPLERTVWEICNEYSWAVPAHLNYAEDDQLGDVLPSDRIVDLFAAETAHALAEMLLLVGDRLHPWIAQRVRLEVERRVFEPTFRGDRPFFWFSAEHNWSAVCAGAVGMAALLLVEDRERLAWMQARVVDAMGSFLSGYGEDGCCMEGAGYWTYGFGYYVYWAEMLHAYTGGEIDLLEGGKIRRIADYAGTVALTVPACVNYSDCAPSIRLHPGLLSRLRRRIGASAPAVPLTPSFHDDHCYRWPHQVRNLLWTDDASAEGRPSTGSFHLPDAGWIIDKRETSAGLFAFSAKGGRNDEPHNHNDLGHFIVHIAGETLLTDLGPGMYTQDYFGPGRYGHLHTSSLGHSVPVINGHGQKGGGEYRAEVLRSEREGDNLHFDLDLSRAYGEEAGLRFFGRSFAWTGREEEAFARLTMRDEFEFADPAEAAVTEHFISLHRPEMEPGKIVWQGARGRAELRYDAELFEAATEELATNAHQSEPLLIYRTALTARQLPERFVCQWSLDCSGV
ncbi:heparinase II/III family protein [Saccharibacillus sp. CPCC 101409]|uniref:heparinase II/III domain-containing protein n=1 Tax=Saccharibacillus sp. CPCC 101409 TaxID=3058041 RepID=UPI002672AE87|nr:heparinase II/III family protein [Saccharibacillus sp. CPCC 101409]MDO3412490.1 heparinase II/III family protein [Saccharibacillus sp. CPCC 101409]